MLTPAASSEPQWPANLAPWWGPKAAVYATLVALTLAFVVAAAVDLANVRPVTEDDAMITLTSASLAREGQLGLPLLRGFHGADRHYFGNLPLQHLLQAALFRMTEPGIAAARLVSVASAVGLLWATTLLALRWYGWRAAVITAVLSVLWRSGLLGMDYGLPLLSVARTARYDVTAAAFLALSVLAMVNLTERPRPALAVLTGALAGAATLTQFHGAFSVPILIALWARARGRPALRDPSSSLLVLGFVVLVAPYAIYLASHAADAVAQLRGLHASRLASETTDFLKNVVREPLRASGALRTNGPGAWTLLVLMPLVMLWIGWRAQRARRLGDVPLLLMMALMIVPLGLLESTKAPLYALPLLPVFCIALAEALSSALTPTGRLAVVRRALAGVLLVVVAAEGVVAYAKDRRAAERVPRYDAVVAELVTQVPETAVIAGSGRWSWGLRARRFEEYRALAMMSSEGPANGSMAPETLSRLLAQRRVAFLLIDEDLRSALSRNFYGESFTRQWERFVSDCTDSEQRWNLPSYGAVELRSVRTQCDRAG